MSQFTDLGVLVASVTLGPPLLVEVTKRAALVGAKLLSRVAYPLALDVGFEKEVATWIEPTSITHAHALELILELSLSSRVEVTSSPETDLTLSRAKAAALSPGNSQNFLGKLRALIVAAKSRHRLDSDQVLTRATAITEWDPTLVDQFSAKALWLARDLTGRRDPSISMIAVYHAAYAIQQLEIDLEETDRINGYRYLRTCYRRFGDHKAGLFAPREQTPWGTFVLSPASTRTCITGCIYAARLAERLQLTTELRSEFLSVTPFLERCWSVRDGAFSVEPGTRGNLIHTHGILHVDRRLQMWNLLNEDRGTAIESFVEECWHDNGGYSFGPGQPPNVYATRLAVQILKLLGREISKPRSDAIGDFLDTLYMSDVGAYAGRKSA